MDSSRRAHGKPPFRGDLSHRRKPGHHPGWCTPSTPRRNESRHTVPTCSDNSDHRYWHDTLDETVHRWRSRGAGSRPPERIAVRLVVPPRRGSERSRSPRLRPSQEIDGPEKPSLPSRPLRKVPPPPDDDDEANPRSSRWCPDREDPYRGELPEKFPPTDPSG